MIKNMKNLMLINKGMNKEMRKIKKENEDLKSQLF